MGIQLRGWPIDGDGADTADADVKSVVSAGLDIASSVSRQRIVTASRFGEDLPIVPRELDEIDWGLGAIPWG